MKGDPVIFEIPRIPISKNTYRGKHWAEQQRIMEEWHDEVMVALNQSDRVPEDLPLDPPVCLEAYFYFKSALDIENPILDGVIDGMVNQGVIQDDNPKHLKRIVKCSRGNGHQQEKLVIRTYTMEVKAHA